MMQAMRRKMSWRNVRETVSYVRNLCADVAAILREIARLVRSP
jgi:hypothetical protein